MKKLQTDQTASQQAGAGSHKKRPLFVILVLCLLLGCGIMISMIVLGSSISRFSKEDAHVIPLIPLEAVSLEPGEKVVVGASGTKTNPGADASGTKTNPGADASGTKTNPAADASQSGTNQNSATADTAGNTNNSTGQPKEYRGEFQVYDDAQTWNSETHVDLFRNSYDGTVRSDDGEKVIAPGVSNFYDFTVKNNGEIPLDYTISLKVDTYLGEQESDSAIPLEWRLLSGDGTAISDWREYSEEAEVLRRATLNIRRQDKYTVEWRWAFEQGEDEADTDMGNLAVNQPLGVNAEIYLYAEQSAGWDGKPPGIWDAPETGDAASPLFYLVLAASSACGLLTVLRVRRKEDKG